MPVSGNMNTQSRHGRFDTNQKESKAMTTFKRDTLNESQSCVAYDAYDREPQSYGNAKDCINLTDGENIVVDGQLGSYKVGTVVSSALRNNEDPIAAYQRAVERRHNTHWLNANATVLTAHKQTKAKMIVVKIGMLVYIEGRRFTITREANNNLGLEAA